MFKLPPLLLHYYITTRCNCRCSFCDIWKLPHQQRINASLDDVMLNLQHGRNLGLRFVDFTGGEPLLHKHLPEMLRRAKTLGYLTTITTNGILYPNVANALRGQVDFLHLSLDALHNPTHDALRGRRTFERVMQSLDVARALGERPDLLFTVTPKTVQHIKPLAQFAKRLQLMLVVNPVFSYGSVSASNLEFLKELDAFRAHPYVYVNTAFHRLRRQGGNQISSPRCRVLDSTVVISPDNHLVLPCYHFQQTALPLNSSSHKNPLRALRQTPTWTYFHKHQGRLECCQGCHLNCYFDPSFSYQLDTFFWMSLLAKSRYWWNKSVRKRIEQKQQDDRPARDIAQDIWEMYGF